MLLVGVKNSAAAAESSVEAPHKSVSRTTI